MVLQEDWDDNGTSGPISWEADGSRRDVSFEVVELARGGSLRHAGLWAPRAGVLWQRTDEPAPAPPRDSMTNRTFNILIARVRTLRNRRAAITHYRLQTNSNDKSDVSE